MSPPRKKPPSRRSPKPFDQYKAFALARHMVASDRTTDEIDSAVRVDDRAAFEALALLERRWRSARDLEAVEQERATEAGQWTVGLALLALPILIAAALGLLWLLRRLVKEVTARAVRPQSIFENTADGIIIIDERGMVESYNPTAKAIFGYQADEVVGQGVSKLMPEPFQGAHGSYLRRYMTEGDPRIIGKGGEVQGRRKDGSIFPLDLAVSEAHQGGKRLFVGLFRDISDRKAVEAQLVEQKQRTGGAKLVRYGDSRGLARTNKTMVRANHVRRSIPVGICGKRSPDQERPAPPRRVAQQNPPRRRGTKRRNPEFRRGHHRYPRGRTGGPASGGDRSVLGRRHPKHDARRHRHVLEPGLGTPVRFLRRGDCRGACRPTGTRRQTRRGRRGTPGVDGG